MAKFADGSRWSIEGSANLCGNGSGREQFALINHAELCDWHQAWIDELIVRHEGKRKSEDGGDGQKGASD